MSSVNGDQNGANLKKWSVLLVCTKPSPMSGSGTSRSTPSLRHVSSTSSMIAATCCSVRHRCLLLDVSPIRYLLLNLVKDRDHLLPCQPLILPLDESLIRCLLLNLFDDCNHLLPCQPAMSPSRCVANPLSAAALSTKVISIFLLNVSHPLSFFLSSFFAVSGFDYFVCLLLSLVPWQEGCDLCPSHLSILHRTHLFYFLFSSDFPFTFMCLCLFFWRECHELLREQLVSSSLYFYLLYHYLALHQEYIRTRVRNTTHWGLARRNSK